MERELRWAFRPEIEFCSHKLVTFAVASLENNTNNSQFGGTKITVAEEEYSIFRDAEYVVTKTPKQSNQLTCSRLLAKIKE